MQKKSDDTNELTEEEFRPKSFIIFCLDDDGEIAFEASWGNTPEDIKNFATLLYQVNNGNFDNIIENQLKEQSKSEPNGSKNFSLFSKTYKSLSSPSMLVIDPMEVILNQ